MDNVATRNALWKIKENTSEVLKSNFWTFELITNLAFLFMQNNNHNLKIHTKGWKYPKISIIEKNVKKKASFPIEITIKPDNLISVKLSPYEHYKDFYYNAQNIDMETYLKNETQIFESFAKRDLSIIPEIFEKKVYQKYDDLNIAGYDFPISKKIKDIVTNKVHIVSNNKEKISKKERKMKNKDLHKKWFVARKNEVQDFTETQKELEKMVIKKLWQEEINNIKQKHIMRDWKWIFDSYFIELKKLLS